MKIKVKKQEAIFEEIEIEFPCYRKKDGSIYFFRDDKFCMRLCTDGDVLTSETGYYHDSFIDTVPATKQEFMEAMIVTEKLLNEVYATFDKKEYQALKAKKIGAFLYRKDY